VGKEVSFGKTGKGETIAGAFLIFNLLATFKPGKGRRWGAMMVAEGNNVHRDRREKSKTGMSGVERRVRWGSPGGSTTEVSEKRD